MSESIEQYDWLVTLPAFESTGGIAQVMTCTKCGASVTVTNQDDRAAKIHLEWHQPRVVLD